jgi:polyhydroxyalkanoate synthase
LSTQRNARPRSRASAPKNAPAAARPTAAEPTGAAPAASGPAPAFGAAFGDLLGRLQGLSLPADQLGGLQGEYLRQASQVWNDALQRLQPGGAVAQPLPDRRFAAAPWLQNPASAYTAQMYLLNARTLMQMAESVQGDAKTKARIRFAVQQWVDAPARATSWPSTPRR